MSEQHSAENDAAHPLVPIVRRAVLQWKASGGDVSVVIAGALADEHREAMARGWDEGWDDRDNECSEPYSPHKVNPYRVIPPGDPMPNAENDAAPCGDPEPHLPHGPVTDRCHGGRVWVCENPWHDTALCIPTKHYGKGER